MTLGEKIKMARLEAGITQRELGEALNVTPSYISHFENDHYEPNKAQLDKLSDILNKDIDYFMVSDEPVKEAKMIDIESEQPKVITTTTGTGTNPPYHFSGLHKQLKDAAPHIGQIYTMERLGYDNDIYLLFRHAGRRWIVFRLYADAKWDTDVRIELSDETEFYTNNASCYFVFDDGLGERVTDAVADSNSMRELEMNFCERWQLMGTSNGNEYKNLYEEVQAEYVRLVNELGELAKKHHIVSYKDYYRRA